VRRIYWQAGRGPILATQIQGNFNEPLFDNIVADIERLPKKFQREFKKQTLKPIRNFRQRIKRPPSRQPAHPFIWSFDQAAQQRARNWWFAAIAGKIPGVRIDTDGEHYRRSGALLNNIRVFIDRPAGTITVTGVDSDAFDFTVGRKQVPSHKRTGWKDIPEELEKASVEFIDKGLEVWDKLTDEVGQ